MEVAEEIVSREEFLKLLGLLEKIFYKGREFEGGVGSRIHFGFIPDSGAGGYLDSAPFSNTCAKYWYLR